MKSRCTLIYRILTALYIIVVLYLCFGKFDNLPQDPIMLFGIAADKIVHFAMFLPFPILMYLSFGEICRNGRQCLLFALVTMIAGIAGAAMTEYLQGLTSYRSADPVDFLADSLSLAIGSLLIPIAHRLKLRINSVR